VDPFQFGCDSKETKSWQIPPLNKSTQQRKEKQSQAKPSQATGGKKKNKERGPKSQPEKKT
jgi:hypothetical protein